MWLMGTWLRQKQISARSKKIMGRGDDRTEVMMPGIIEGSATYCKNGFSDTHPTPHSSSSDDHPDLTQLHAMTPLLHHGNHGGTSQWTLSDVITPGIMWPSCDNCATMHYLHHLIGKPLAGGPGT